MFGRGTCEKYQSRDEIFPELNVEGNLVSRLVFFANTPTPKQGYIWRFDACEGKKVKSSCKYPGSGKNERN